MLRRTRPGFGCQPALLPTAYTSEPKLRARAASVHSDRIFHEPHRRVNTENSLLCEFSKHNAETDTSWASRMTVEAYPECPGCGDDATVVMLLPEGPERMCRRCSRIIEYVAKVFGTVPKRHPLLREVE